ncbi:MAG: ATP-binding cassette domain-containing protein [Promethearchaeota archaeon]
MDDQPFIEFNKISKSYKDINALDEISFQIRKGDIFGFIGPNGAGKTTTLKILVGLIGQNSGRIYLNGKNLSENRKKLHSQLGYLPQEGGFQQWRTVNHALKTFGLLSGVERDKLNTRINYVLNLVGLSEVRHKKIVHLSGGMIQKLKLAQAILHNPALLVLDEPFSGLDPTSRFQMKGLIKHLSIKGITIFFSSHILNDVENLATIIGILNRGKLMKVGTPAQLYKEFQIGNNIEINIGIGSKFPEELNEKEYIESIEQPLESKLLLHLKSGIDLDKCIHEILRKLIEDKCSIRNFNLQQPSLEDVYLHYTGGGKK